MARVPAPVTGTEIDATDHDDAIRDTLQGEMQGIEGEWQFRVQLCRDLDEQPVENPTVEWKEDEAPFRRVATIRVMPQDRADRPPSPSPASRSRHALQPHLALIHAAIQLGEGKAHDR